MSDNRSKRFVMVPFCVLAQAFHASGLVKYDWQGVIKPIIQTLIDRDINIIQMPCLETLYHGLNRQPHGMKHYDVPEFRSFCNFEAIKVINQIKNICNNGYTVAVILGMEYSPSCAVKVQYPPRKNQTNMGVYMQELTRLLNETGLQIPFLGINRRGIKPTIKRLEHILDGN